MWDSFKIFKFMVFAFSLNGLFLKAICQGDTSIHTDNACMQLDADNDSNNEYDLMIDSLDFSNCNNGHHHFLHIISLRITDGSCMTQNTCFGQQDNGYMVLLQEVERRVIHCVRQKDSECEMIMNLPAACSGNHLFMEYNYSCPGMSTTARETTSQMNSDDQEMPHMSDLSQGVKIAIAVVAVAVALLLLILLIVCLVRRHRKTQESKSLPRPDLEGAVNAASEQSTVYTSYIPEHVHYIPYDLLTNARHASQYEEIPDNQVTKKPQSSVVPTGEYAEIDGESSGGYAALRTSQMTEDKTTTTGNAVPKRDTSYAIPNKLIQNVAYQSLDDYPKDNYDNAGHTYLKLSSEGEDLSREHSVPRMVVNDVYNE